MAAGNQKTNVEADYLDDCAPLGTWQREQKRKASDPLQTQDPWYTPEGSQAGTSEMGGKSSNWKQKGDEPWRSGASQGGGSSKDGQQKSDEVQSEKGNRGGTVVTGNPGGGPRSVGQDHLPSSALAKRQSF